MVCLGRERPLWARQSVTVTGLGAGTEHTQTPSSQPKGGLLPQRVGAGLPLGQTKAVAGVSAEADFMEKKGKSVLG